MVIQIPTGREVKVESNEVFRERDGKIYVYPRKIEAFPKITGASPKDYALVQEGNQARYAIFMKQRFSGLQFVPANVKVLQSGLLVPTPAIFMPHHKNVNEAQQGRVALYDASGNIIEGKRLDNYSNTLNHNCWVWLGASFEKGKGFRGLDLVTIKGLDKEGKPIMEGSPLEDCLEEDAYADLESLNSQGLPTKKSPVQQYEPGKTLYFAYPRIDSAVGFYAGPDDAYLVCGRYPLVSFSRLGVFDCAEGAAKNK